MAGWIYHVLHRDYDIQATDISRLLHLCRLYRGDDPELTRRGEEVREYDLESPSLHEQQGTLHSEEFNRRYSYVIKTLFSLMRLGVPICVRCRRSTVLCTVDQLLTNIAERRRQIAREHIDLLREQVLSPEDNSYADYYAYAETYLLTLKVLTRLQHNLHRVIEARVITQDETLLALLLPYFAKKHGYIEEYEI